MAFPPMKKICKFVTKYEAKVTKLCVIQFTLLWEAVKDKEIEDKKR